MERLCNDQSEAFVGIRPDATLVVPSADPECAGQHLATADDALRRGLQDVISVGPPYHYREGADLRTQLCTVMKLVGITQTEVAAAIGIHRSNVAHQLKGRERLQPITISTIQTLCQQRAVLRAVERPCEIRRLIPTKHGDVAVTDYGLAGIFPFCLSYHRELDRSPWHHLVKQVGWAVGGLVTDAAFGEFDVVTPSGLWSVHIHLSTRTEGDEGCTSPRGWLPHATPASSCAMSAPLTASTGSMTRA